MTMLSSRDAQGIDGSMTILIAKWVIISMTTPLMIPTTSIWLMTLVFLSMNILPPLVRGTGATQTSLTGISKFARTVLSPMTSLCPILAASWNIETVGLIFSKTWSIKWLISRQLTMHLIASCPAFEVTCLLSRALRPSKISAISSWMRLMGYLYLPNASQLETT